MRRGRGLDAGTKRRHRPRVWLQRSSRAGPISDTSRSADAPPAGDESASVGEGLCRWEPFMRFGVGGLTSHRFLRARQAWHTSFLRETGRVGDCMARCRR